MPFFALRKDTVQAAGSPDSGEMTTESKRGPGQAQVPAESKVLQRTLLPDSALPHTSSSYRVSNQGHVRGPPPQGHTPCAPYPAEYGPVLCMMLAVPVFQMPTGSSCLGPSLATCPRRYGGRLVSAVGLGGQGASCPLIRATVCMGAHLAKLTGLYRPCRGSECT